MKISISGGEGFIGKLISKHFSNHIISYIDRKNIIISSDTDIVIHLAGISNDLSSKYSYNYYLIGNFELTKKIFKAFKSSRASTFIFFSTSKIYGDSGFFNENSKTNPNSYYAKTKLKAEKFLMKNFNIESKSILILRPSLVYSNKTGFIKGNLHLLKKIISFFPVIIFPKIENRRSYCSVDNIYNLIKFLEHNKINSGVYNLSDTKSVSTYDLVKYMSQNKSFIALNKFLSSMLVNLANNSPKINKLSKKLFCDFIIDNSKIKEITGLPFDNKIIK